MVVSYDDAGNISGGKCSGGGTSSPSDPNSSGVPSSAPGSSGGTDSGTKSGDSGSSSGAKAGTKEKSCFPGRATAELESGRTVRMDELAVGDRVRVGAAEFSPVFLFTHKVGAVVNRFVRITIASGHAISATPGHYLYVNGELAAAATVKVGDMMTLGSGALSPVAAVSVTTERGLFNPQTAHGDIVVDGVLSSTYTTAVSPKVAHSVLSPIRALYAWCGVSTTMLEGGAPRFLLI
jgi:hypothetical protein